jgi:hypothetical protein
LITFEKAGGPLEVFSEGNKEEEEEEEEVSSQQSNPGTEFNLMNLGNKTYYTEGAY